MIRSAALVLAGSLMLSATAAFAQGPPPLPFPPLPLPFPNFQGTPEDQKACRPDVVKMCKDAASTEDSSRVLACLQANRARLSPACYGVLAKYGQL
jgi:hypothetical protein